VLAALPQSAGLHTRLLWPSVELLAKARLLGGSAVEDPLPLTRRWVPMGETPVRAAMEELEALGHVTRAGSYVPLNGLRTILWQLRLDSDAGRASSGSTVSAPGRES
jgi:hypothetical protein